MLVHLPELLLSCGKVAHSEVYGYGFRPYEYLPPPSSPDNSTAARQEALLGMHSLRSFIFPKMLMLVLHLKEYVGVQANPFIVAKVAHAFTAGHLPLAVYYFTGACAGPDVAATSAILVACTDLLVVFGTHPLVNSFLSPFLFASLGLVMRHFLQLQCEADSKEPKKQTSPNAKLYDDLTKTHVPNEMITNGYSRANGSSSPTANGTANGWHNGRHNGWQNGGQNGAQNGGQTRWQNGWPNGCANEQHNGGPVKYSQTSGHTTRCLDNWDFRNKLNLIFGSALLGLLTYLRLDAVMVLSVCLVPVIVSKPWNRTLLGKVLQASLGTTFGVLIAAADDYKSYGSWFISPVQWYRFNVQNDFSSTIFGTAAILTYAKEVFAGNYTLVSLCSLIAICCICLVTKRFRDTNKDLVWPYMHFLCSFLVLVSIYSLKSHKEIRFIHDVITLFLVTSAFAAIILYKTVLRLFALNSRRLARCLFWACLGLYVACNVVRMPSASSKSNAKLTYLNHWDSNHINDCLDFVGRQPDSRGVFMDRSFHISGGYSVLHKDIPIFSLVHYEFQEFSKESRLALEPNNVLWNRNQEMHVSVLGRVSNFVTIENTPLLLKYLILQPEYNYWVVRRKRVLIQVGLEEVYTSGTMRVMKRIENEAIDVQLRQIADDIKIGTNSTVLEYEGSWLYTLGLFSKAIERLEAALKLNPSRIRTYQLLALCFKAVGDLKQASEISRLCQRVYGVDKCMEPQPRVLLHNEYALNVPV